MLGDVRGEGEEKGKGGGSRGGGVGILRMSGGKGKRRGEGRRGWGGGQYPSKLQSVEYSSKMFKREIKKLRNKSEMPFSHDCLRL